MPTARQKAALEGKKLMAFLIMAEVKHSFRHKVKHSLLACEAKSHEHKAMLNDEKKEAERLALAKRLSEAIKAAPSKTAIAVACGVSDQAVTGWLKTGRVHKRNLPVIAKETGYSLQWLLDGAEPKLSGQPKEKERELPNVTEGPAIQGRVPLISWVQAGDFSTLVDNYHPGDGEDWIPVPIPVRRHTFALRVQGDSMKPEFLEGDIVIVEPDAEAVSGSYVVVRANDDQECTFKQLIRDSGRLLLKPVNERYDIMSFPADGHIVGVVKCKVKMY